MSAGFWLPGSFSICFWFTGEVLVLHSAILFPSVLEYLTPIHWIGSCDNAHSMSILASIDIILKPALLWLMKMFDWFKLLRHLCLWILNMNLVHQNTTILSKIISELNLGSDSFGILGKKPLMKLQMIQLLLLINNLGLFWAPVSPSNTLCIYAATLFTELFHSLALYLLLISVKTLYFSNF